MVLKAVAVEKTSYIQAEIPAPIYPVVLYAANLSLISFFFSFVMPIVHFHVF